MKPKSLGGKEEKWFIFKIYFFLLYPMNNKKIELNYE